eukprot:1349978-Amorphochlora_amoeboformis.AAC.2
MLSPVGPSPSITGPSPPPRALVHPNSNTILEFTPSEVHFHDCGVKDQVVLMQFICRYLGSLLSDSWAWDSDCCAIISM